MVSDLFLRKINKREWAIGAFVAFVLLVAVCAFEGRDGSVWKDPAFLRFVFLCAAFFGGAVIVSVPEKPWIPLAVTVCGAVLVCVFAGSWAVLYITVLFPAQLLLWTFRFFPPDRPRRFLPVCLCVFVPEMAAAVFLVVRIVALHMPFEFFIPQNNRRLSGFWPLVFLFCVYFIGIVSELRREKRATKTEPPQKKKNGKPPVRRVPVWLRHAPSLPFIACAALCFVYTWYLGERFLPYPLLIDSAALLVLLGAFGVEAQRPA